MSKLEGPNQVKSQESKQEKVFTNISFVEKKDKKGRVVAYESSAPGRKLIRCVFDGRTGVPDLSKEYTVKVVKDSYETDALSGFYLVEIVQDENTDWPTSEKSVESVEDKTRQIRKSRVELRKETGTTELEREGLTGKEIIEKAERPRVASKALEKEMRLNDEVEKVLGADNSSERQFVSFQFQNLRKALKEEAEISKRIEKLREEQSDILNGIENEPTGSELEALDDIDVELIRAESRREQLIASSPEAYYGLHLKQLKKYKDNLENGRIVETPYVTEHIQDIVSHMRANRPVMIYGHLGSGKTELALHVARNYILNNRPDIDEIVQKELGEWLKKNPDATFAEIKKEFKEIDASHRTALVISGSKNMSITEFYGHQILSVKEVKTDESDAFALEVEGKYKKWVLENSDNLEKMNEKEREQEKNLAHDRLLQTYLTQFKGGTISDFFLGPIYRAMAEGRPIIIDEVNAIPHEVLISLNHILTRRVGDEINVQQNSGTAITIKEGYGVIMTGNLNQGDERYVDRQDMDPALLSRLYKIEFDYLPQKTEGTLEQEVGEGNELFQLLIAKVMDKNGNIEVPDETLDKLWNLAKAARVIQNVFSGKDTSEAHYFKNGGLRAVQYVLKESVLSIRGLDKIITQWQKEGYRYELDYYLWKEFVSQSTNPTDKAYLYQLLKDQFGFFTGDGWEQKPNYGNGGVINSFNIKAPKNGSSSPLFYGPRMLIDTVYGAGPVRSQWPNKKKS